LTVDISSSATGDDTMNGTIDSPGDLNISDGTISGSSNYGKLNAGSDASLPVTLSAFSAHWAEQSIVLEWITESEVDNLGFILERSETNKKTWHIISSYKTHEEFVGHGNVSSSTEYTFTDSNVKSDKQYWYRLSDVNTNRDVTLHAPVSIMIIDQPELSKMENAYPNPFNPQTYIAYHLGQYENINISVYDLLGRRISTLLNRKQQAGNYHIYWNGLNGQGMKVSSGAYIIRMQTESTTQIQKVLFMK